MTDQSHVLEDLKERVRGVIEPREGACGTCHAVSEEICRASWSISTREHPKGIAAEIIDEEGSVRGKGFGIVWSPAVLDAQLDAGLIPKEFSDDLKRDGTSTDEDVDLVSDLFGYGRVVTPAALALSIVQGMGGRTLIRREGLGVVATFYDGQGGELARSPRCYCPTCAVTVGAAKHEPLADQIRDKLRDKPNTGRKKYLMGIENRYEVKNGHVRVTLAKGDEILARRILGCCMAYATVKAEIVAKLVPQASAEQFKIYCNLCPFKHCWMDKSMGATGNIILHRLTEIGTEVEVTASGGIVARIPGQDIQGRGTLCSLSALTNLLLRADATDILKPAGSKDWAER